MGRKGILGYKETVSGESLAHSRAVGFLQMFVFRGGRGA